MSRDPALADPAPTEDSESLTTGQIHAMWEDEVSPHEMQYWRRDIRKFIAGLTTTDPLLSRVVRWFKCQNPS